MTFITGGIIHALHINVSAIEMVAVGSNVVSPILLKSPNLTSDLFANRLFAKALKLGIAQKSPPSDSFRASYRPVASAS
jgi:hypothetical protein